MRALIIALSLLLAGCSGAWPSGSYTLAISKSDAEILAPAIADYLTGSLPSSTTLAVVTAPDSDPIAPLLRPDLDRAGFAQEADGLTVRYVAAPLDAGVLLRISVGDSGGASRYYARAANGDLMPGGPFTVANPR